VTNACKTPGAVMQTLITALAAGLAVWGAEVFKPNFKEAFWARHTPTLRKLTCTCCGYHGFCVETYGKEEKKNG